MDSIINNDILHSGVAHDENPPGRGSGRYAFGSGENPNQHQYSLLSEIRRLRKNGYSDDEIAKVLVGHNCSAKDLKHAIIARTNISTAQVKKLRDSGMTELEIAKELLGDDASVAQLKGKIAIAEKREAKEFRDKVVQLYSKTITDKNPEGNKSEVARKLGVNESRIRAALKESSMDKHDEYFNTAEVIKKSIDESPSGIVDVSRDVEIGLGVTRNTKNIALTLLQEQGYIKTWVKVQQLGTNKPTSVMVMAKPKDGETIHDTMVRVQKERLNFSEINESSTDGGKTFFVPEYPSSIDSKRIYLRTPSEGGALKDGVIEIRRGVKDLSLGDSHYAQVRIAVDGTHYLKGMAVYSDDIPKGYDIVYNSSKPDDWPMIGPNKDEEVLKRIKPDADAPFGATIKAGGQSYYKDPKGDYVQVDDGVGKVSYRKATSSDSDKDRYALSPVNKISEEGDWDKWSKTLSSQFLSKQPLKLINQQLTQTVNETKSEFEDIMNLTNPVIKKYLLQDFAASCDKKAADLKATGFKNQAFQVLLPLTQAKETEVYAPNYDNGDVVALIRYPHSGTFEIPVLKVNNNIKGAKDIIGTSRDAVGINPKVASILSGADFDGDTALVIPIKSNNIKIQTREPFKELSPDVWDFHNIYRLPEDAKAPKPATAYTEMGKVTNLIMDMTLQGADDAELLKAVKHSMVVIDCAKHRLDYKQSEKDNDIIALKKKYQGENARGGAKGAATVITRAGSYDRQVPERVEKRKSEMTEEELKAWYAGKKIYKETGRMIDSKRITKIPEDINNPKPNEMTKEELERHKQGLPVYRKLKKPRLAVQKEYRINLHDDAKELIREPDNPNAKELSYANFANEMKRMAEKARAEYRSMKAYPVDLQAKQLYSTEIKSLKNKLQEAKINTPRERAAQALGNKMLQEKIKENPDLRIDDEHLGREKNRCLTNARAAMGASKKKIEITDKEWEAIQSKGISSSLVLDILRNTDQDAFKERATPKNKGVLSPAKIALAKSLIASGSYTNKEIADKLGVSVSTLYRYIYPT